MDYLGVLCGGQYVPGLGFTGGQAFEAGGGFIVGVDLDAEPVSDVEYFGPDGQSPPWSGTEDPLWPPGDDLVEAFSGQRSLGHGIDHDLVACQPDFAGAGRGFQLFIYGVVELLGGPHFGQEDGV